MANATYNSGNLTREAGAPVSAYRLVKLVDGKVEHNDPGTFPFGALTESAAPKDSVNRENFIGHGLPHLVRVHTDKGVVKIETNDTGFTDGATVYAADDGTVATTGTVAVGIADRPEDAGRVRVHLFHPAAQADAPAGEPAA